MGDDTEKKVFDFLKHLKDKGITPNLQSIEGDNNTQKSYSDNTQQTIKGSNNKQKSKRKSSKQHIEGNNNVQISTSITTAKHTQKIEAVPGTIGANSALKNRINELINKICEERIKSQSCSFASAKKGLTGRMKKDLGYSASIRWDIYTYSMTENYAIDVVIPYLQGKYDKTIGGKIAKSKSKNKTHTRAHMMKLETEALKQIGLKPDSPEVRQLMDNIFGVTSHRQLPDAQLYQFVEYMENRVEKILIGHCSSLCDGYTPETQGFTVKTFVKHAVFGYGVVTSVIGTGENAQIEVVFEDNNIRKILARFLEVIDI